MGYQNPTFKGDAAYSREATGDVVVGDEICFEQAKFSGSFRNAKFEGFEKIEGKVIRDSYGSEKQQHTFTLELKDGSELKIKGRNLYKNGVFRKEWENESDRELALDEKHQRGDVAREARRIRKSEGIGF